MVVCIGRWTFTTGSTEIKAVKIISSGNAAVETVVLCLSQKFLSLDPTQVLQIGVSLRVF